MNFSSIMTEEEKAIRKKISELWTRQRKVGYKTFEGREIERQLVRLKARRNLLVDQRHALDGWGDEE